MHPRPGLLAAEARPDPCPCGTGLSHALCCGLDPAWPLPPVPHAMAAFDAGDTEAAERACLDALERDPLHRQALRILLRLRRASGPPTSVAVILRRLVQLDPNDFVATNELALELLAQGNLPEAELQARNAVRIAPENAQAHNLLGMALTESQRPQHGEFHYRRSLTLSGGRDPVLLANLAWSLKLQGRMDEARTLYQESLHAAPDVPQTWLGWVRLEEADRQLEQAAALLDQAEARFPGDPRFLVIRAVLQGRLRQYEAALATLDRTAGADGRLGPDELLEKGALLDRMGRYDDAFAAFTEGKRQVRALTGDAYLADHAAQLAGRLARFFVAGRLALLPQAPTLERVPQPLFILGFPRSGTTLMEQMLTAHPHIAAGDELPFIAELTNLLPRMLGSPLAYPEALSELWMADHRDDLGTLRDHYLQRVRQQNLVTAGATRFTDKMPLNETHLGLIALLFPQAPLVHLIRHPLDVVLSTFSNNLTHGFFCSYALETAARHYVLVMDLVEHYRREMALCYLPIRYEDLVEHPEASVRRVLAFVGEPFDPACMRFEENRRYARTASYAQVTERLYRRSLYRYRNYIEHLRPVLPILQPVIERLGYRVD